MKTVKTNNLLQVVCKNLQEQLNALITYPRYAYDRKGVNGEVILYFYL